MSKFDGEFVATLKDIIEYGTSYVSRAVWEDGEHAVCYKQVGVVNRYNEDYSNTPPIGTLRRFPIKNCIDEILWIWQKKSNNIKDLNSKIWDSWADPNGSIGAAYGFQVANKLRKATHTVESGDGSKEVITSYLDQTDYVLHELRYNPFSRRIITDLYAVNETQLMGLDPCVYGCTWNVTVKDQKKYLNLVLNQRSQDMVVANNWNVFQYWVLQNLFAQEVGMHVGSLVHVIADAHIYDRHMKIAEELIGLYDDALHYPEPEIIINPDHKSFYDITPNDIKMYGYNYAIDIKNIPVAV